MLLNSFVCIVRTRGRKATAWRGDPRKRVLVQTYYKKGDTFHLFRRLAMEQSAARKQFYDSLLQRREWG